MSAMATEDEQTGHAANRVWEEEEEEEEEEDVVGLGRLRPLPVVPAVGRPSQASILLSLRARRATTDDASGMERREVASFKTCLEMIGSGRV